MAFFKQDCFLEARECFSSILDKTADEQELADAWLNIACTYRLENEWVKAQDALTQAKRLAPEDPAITDEEIELMKAKLTAVSISISPRLFGNSKAASQEVEYKTEEESNFQFK